MSPFKSPFNYLWSWRGADTKKQGPVWGTLALCCVPTLHRDPGRRLGVVLQRRNGRWPQPNVPPLCVYFVCSSNRKGTSYPSLYEEGPFWATAFLSSLAKPSTSPTPTRLENQSSP